MRKSLAGRAIISTNPILVRATYVVTYTNIAYVTPATRYLIVGNSILKGSNATNLMLEYLAMRKRL